MENPAIPGIDHPVTGNLYVTLACALIVALYALKRYNTPETNRISTTRSLFLVTGAGYVGASLLVFFLLCEVVLKPGVLPFLGGDDVQKLLKDFSTAPVLATVLLTTFLPNTPVISDADTWLLKRFQAWGRIPQGVLNLADKLTLTAQQLVESDIQKLREWMIADGDVPDELAGSVGVDTPDSPRGGLTRVIRLYSNLQRLLATPSYINSFRSQQNDWQTIQAGFRVFLAESQAFLVLFDHLSKLEGSAEEAALNKAKRCYREICQNSHEHMAEFLAQLFIAVEGTERLINDRLKTVGFVISGPSCPNMDAGPLLFLGVVMIMFILLLVSTVPVQPIVLPLGVTAILIGVTRTIGVLSAVVPKLRWSKYRTDSDGNYPYLAWLAWASVAAIASFLIERTVIAVAHHALSAELDFKYPFSPMAPLAGLTTLSIAILCDVDLRLPEGWLRRSIEGLLCAFALTIGMFICTQLLDLTPATEGQAPAWLPFVVSSTVGFVCGFFAPYLYRRACSHDSWDRISLDLREPIEGH